MTILHRYRAPRLQLAWQMAIACMVNILSLALPIMMLQVYDRIIPHQAYSTLAWLVIGVLTALIFDAALRTMRAYLASWTAVKHEQHAGSSAIKHFLDADINSFETHNSGTHLQNMAALSRLREFYSGQAMMAMIDVPFAALFLGLIAYIGGWLVLVPIGLLTVFALCARVGGNALKKALEARSQSDDRKSDFIVSVLTAIHTVKAKGMEEMMMRHFEAPQSDTTRASYQVAMASGLTSILSSVFGQLSLILTVTIGALFVIDGNLSIGGLSACTLLSGRAIQPMQRVLGAWLRLQDLSVSHQQAASLFAIPQMERAKPDKIATRGTITLQNASFGYAGQAPLLTNLSLAVEPGEVIAIKGDKGSGKSTLLQMLAGLHVPTQGSVRIDGIDPALHRMSDLTDLIGYLPQQGAIFKGTLLENLTGFREDDITIARAKEIVATLGLAPVIDQLPKGYLTPLTDSPADAVPPGVKQRIALARVLLHRPKIVLFDDADRMLDKEGYNRLFRMMGDWKGKATIILASHDQNLLSLADRSFVLTAGRLIAESESLSQRVVFLNQAYKERA